MVQLINQSVKLEVDEKKITPSFSTITRLHPSTNVLVVFKKEIHYNQGICKPFSNYILLAKTRVLGC